MSVTIPAWAIPLALTIAVWAWGILMPMPAQSNLGFDFSGLLSTIFRGFVCVAGTLLFWLVYFMVKAWT